MGMFKFLCLYSAQDPSVASAPSRMRAQVPRMQAFGAELSIALNPRVILERSALHGAKNLARQIN